MAIKKEVYLGQMKLVKTLDFQLSYDVSVVYKSHNLSSGHPIGTVTRYLEQVVKRAIC
jgi:hypothetical protein